RSSRATEGGALRQCADTLLWVVGDNRRFSQVPVMPSQAVTQRFISAQAEVRGELAPLNDSYRKNLARADQPAPTQALLRGMLAPAVLRSPAIKFDGLLVMQARSSGPLSTLMVECSSRQEVRGIARYADELSGDTLSELMPDGVLAITVDPERGQR